MYAPPSSPAKSSIWLRKKIGPYNSWMYFETLRGATDVYFLLFLAEGSDMCSLLDSIQMILALSKHRAEKNERK